MTSVARVSEDARAGDRIFTTRIPADFVEPGAFAGTLIEDRGSGLIKRRDADQDPPVPA